MYNDLVIRKTPDHLYRYYPLEDLKVGETLVLMGDEPETARQYIHEMAKVWGRTFHTSFTSHEEGHDLQVCRIA